WRGRARPSCRGPWRAPGSTFARPAAARGGTETAAARPRDGSGCRKRTGPTAFARRRRQTRSPRPDRSRRTVRTPCSARGRPRPSPRWWRETRACRPRACARCAARDRRSGRRHAPAPPFEPAGCTPRSRPPAWEAARSRPFRHPGSTSGSTVALAWPSSSYPRPSRLPLEASRRSYVDTVNMKKYPAIVMRKPRRPKRYHHGDLPRALLDAALHIVETQGTQALTLRAAERSAGVSQAAPYRHFTNKEAILAAVAEEGFRSLMP